MPAWNYLQTNASAGLSRPPNTINERRSTTSSMYTHWSQQHLENNPDAGFELLRGLMQMSGSHDPLPLPARTAIRNNDHAETRSNDSTYSVLSNSTKNADYTLGTPYSTISSSSSSAYPVANTVPDIPLTSWMLPETRDRPSAGPSTDYENGFASTPSYMNPSRNNFGRSSFDEHTSPRKALPLPNAMKQTSRQSFGEASTFSAFTNQHNFKRPFMLPSSFSAHITRDGNLPATFYPHGVFGIEEGETIDETRFTDPPSTRTVGPARNDDIWNFPARASDVQNRDRFAKPFVRHFQTPGKGKEKDVDPPRNGTSLHSQRSDSESRSDMNMDDDEAQDGYMRNCEPIINNGKKRFRSSNILGSPGAQSASEASQVQKDAVSQTERPIRRGRSIESPAYQPESSVEFTQRPKSQNPTSADYNSDGVTDEPCKKGERPRMAYVEIAPFLHRNPGRKSAYVYWDLPPLPSRSLRKAAIAARQIVTAAIHDSINTRFENAEETEQQIESGHETEPEEVVIAGDRFLTKDDDEDAQQDTCHQCRVSSKKPKMFCQNIEVECSLRFCESCVDERYDFRFDTESRLFICPVCQGYCNCFRCLEEADVANKLHLRTIMDGTPEEGYRILKRYRNVQKFLEAMGAMQAPPVPRTTIHVARIIRKAEDKQSAPIPQEIYHGLMKPERMAITYRSMLPINRVVAEAFPKKSKTPKKRKHRQIDRSAEGDDFDLADESQSESDDGEQQKRERKKARCLKKKAKPDNPPQMTLPAGPFQFEYGPDGGIRLDHNGDPIVKPIVSPNATPYDKKASTRRNNKKQVTFSEEVDPSLGAWPGAEDDHAPPPPPPPPPPPDLLAETMQQTVEYIHEQLDKHRQQKDNPGAFPDFQLDPALLKLFEEDARSGQMARHILEGGDEPWEEPPPDAFPLGPPSPNALQHALAIVTANEHQCQSDQQEATHDHTLIVETVNSPNNYFTGNANVDDHDLHSLDSKAQEFQNDPFNDELDAIFGLFANAACEVQDGQDDGPDECLEMGMEVGCIPISEI